MSKNPIKKIKRDQRQKTIPKEISLFLAKWDEDYGPEVIDFYPKSIESDLESLAINIFAAFQFFYDSPDQDFKRTYMKLPISKFNKKAMVLLEVIHNPDVRGGLQPFFVALLVPDYLRDEDLGLFEGIINKVARRYAYEQELVLKINYNKIEKIFLQDLMKQPVVVLDEN
ncbi:MAG: hypothetical protein EU544_06295, partial [Promethearchaeota archaeon]